MNTLTYDNNGNLTSDGVKSYTWDRANRLLKWDNGIAADLVNHTYDGEGRRVLQAIGTTSPTITKYLLDIQPGLAVVLAQTEGSDVTRFVHAPRGIHARQDASNDWHWTVQDGLSTVRMETDNSVGVEGSQNLDPFGNLIDLNGTIGTPYGFTGELVDGSGLLDLRARRYNVGIGVFASLDPYEGRTCTPMSLNGYSWVEGNVPNMVDPTGMITGLETSLILNKGICALNQSRPSESGGCSVPFWGGVIWYEDCPAWASNYAPPTNWDNPWSNPWTGTGNDPVYHPYDPNNPVAENLLRNLLHKAGINISCSTPANELPVGNCGGEARATLKGIENLISLASYGVQKFTQINVWADGGKIPNVSLNSSQENSIYNIYRAGQAIGFPTDVSAAFHVYLEFRLLGSSMVVDSGYAITGFLDETIVTYQNILTPNPPEWRDCEAFMGLDKIPQAIEAVGRLGTEAQRTRYRTESRIQGRCPYTPEV